MTDEMLLKKITEIISEHIDPVHKDIKKIKKNLTKTNKTLDFIARDYDARIVQNARDIDQIKDLTGFRS